jgi:hypothetical protein
MSCQNCFYGHGIPPFEGHLSDGMGDRTRMAICRGLAEACDAFIGANKNEIAQTAMSPVIDRNCFYIGNFHQLLPG